MTSAQPDAASARTPLAHIFPSLPPAHNFSVLGNASQFRKYIFAELPLALTDVDEARAVSPLPPPPPPPAEKLRRAVNSAFINSFLKRPEKVVVGTLEWVSTDVFPDTKLPTPFLQAKVTRCEKLWDLKSIFDHLRHSYGYNGDRYYVMAQVYP